MEPVHPSLEESKITTHTEGEMTQPGPGGFSGEKIWKIKPEEKAGGAEGWSSGPCQWKKGCLEAT